MKKILITLSLFLLTNVSLANSFEQLDNPISRNSLGVYSSIVFLTLFLIIFISSMIFTIKKCKLLLINDNEAEKKKIATKCLLYFIISFVFLAVGKLLLTICFAYSGGFYREPNYIDVIFNLMTYISLISIVILGIIIELIKRKKINNNRLLHIVSIMAIVLVSVFSAILIFGLLRGDYYNTTYLPM